MKRSKQKICVVTGTRAEYGLLCLLMKALKADPAFELQVIATCMHLSPEYGSTYRQIEKDGFKIDEKIEMLLSSDTAMGTTKSIGLAVIGFADAFARLKPDLVLVLGDRYELLAAAQAALVAAIPVAHLGGGEDTPCAFDNTIRHCLTKVAQLHFPFTKKCAERILKMGEHPQRVHLVGHPGLDYIAGLKPLKRAALEKALGFRLRARNFLITYHPTTLAGGASRREFLELLAALHALGPDAGLIFTYPNSDPGGREIIKLVDDCAAKHANAKAFASLGQDLYLHTARTVDLLIGNSSSGICEAPFLKKPSVNIGDRQRGRVQARSTVDAAADARSIGRAIEKALRLDVRAAQSPYGSGRAIGAIMSALRRCPDFSTIVQKSFHG